MSKESDLIYAYEDALSNHLHAHWPFRHTDGYGVDARVVEDEDVSANGYLGRDNHDDPCSFAEITISTGALYNLSFDGLVAEGRVILHAWRMVDRDYRAVWVEQSRGYSLKVVKGFWIRGQFIETDDQTKAYRIAEARELKVAA